MQKKEALGIFGIILYSLVCVGIIAWNYVLTKTSYIYFSVPDGKGLLFFCVILACVIVPIGLSIWFIVTYNKPWRNVSEKEKNIVKITVALASILLSLLVGGAWAFFAPGQSYTENPGFYGKYDSEVERIMGLSEIDSFFPESLDDTVKEKTEYRYLYTHPFWERRHILIDLIVTFPTSKEYHDALDLISENEDFTEIDGAYISKMSIEDEKAYVLTGPLTLEYYYEYGRD